MRLSPLLMAWVVSALLHLLFVLPTLVGHPRAGDPPDDTIRLRIRIHRPILFACG